MENIEADMCRLCLQISSDMEDIDNYIETIEITTGIKVTNEFGNSPMKICFECLSSVFLTRNFKKKCLENDNWLQENNSRIIQQNEEIEMKFEIEDESIQNNITNDEVNYGNLEPENNISTTSNNDGLPLPDHDEKIITKKGPIIIRKKRNKGKHTFFTRRKRSRTKKKCIEGNNSRIIQQNEEIEMKFEIEDESIQNNITNDEVNYGNLEPENNISTTSNNDGLPLPDHDDKVITKKGPIIIRKKRKKGKHTFFTRRKRRRAKKNTEEKPSPIKKVKKKYKIKKRYEEKKYSCHLCGKYYNSYHLQFHLNMHYDIRPFICEFPDCGKGFYSVAQQRMHFKTVHTNFSLYQCEICGKLSKTKERYEIHRSYHFDPKLPCNVCGKLQRNRKSLKKHMLVHTDERNFRCI